MRKRATTRGFARQTDSSTAGHAVVSKEAPGTVSNGWGSCAQQSGLQQFAHQGFQIRLQLCLRN